jgi:hypothetical protein
MLHRCYILGRKSFEKHEFVQSELHIRIGYSSRPIHERKKNDFVQVDETLLNRIAEIFDGRCYQVSISMKLM